MAEPTLNERVRDSIQTIARGEEGLPESAVVVGYVAVVEWIGPDGSRMLSRFDAGADGGRLTQWQRQGLLHNALHSEEGWAEQDQEEDDHGST